MFQKKYIGKDYVAYGSDLVLDKEKAWKQISRRARRSIEEAKNIPNLRIEKREGNEEDMKLFRSVWYDSEDKDLDMNNFGKNTHHTYFAYLDGRFVAGIIAAEVKHHLFLQFLGSNDEAKKLNIPSFLIWHIVHEFHGSKHKFLDIGCSFRSTLQEFFKNWATYEYPIIYHSPDLTPKIDATPFGSESMNVLPDDSVNVDVELEKKFGPREFTYFPRGKYAIYSILKHLDLKKDEEVFITTTTGSPYLSIGVSTTIEDVCLWSRKIGKKTKAIFLIHEFGFVHPKLKEMRELADRLKIPLIEDCAYAWQSGEACKYGDFVIYSFPKFFPVQYGGLLVGKHFADRDIWDRFSCLDVGKTEVIKRQLSSYIKDIQDIVRKRRENYAYVEKLCRNEDFEPFFDIKDNETPGMFVLKVENHDKIIEICSRLKLFGIECGGYYHNDAVFLPIHQNLGKAHLDYIFGALRSRYRLENGIYPPEYFDKIYESKRDRNDRAEEGWGKQ